MTLKTFIVDTTVKCTPSPGATIQAAFVQLNYEQTVDSTANDSATASRIIDAALGRARVSLGWEFEKDVGSIAISWRVKD